MDEITSRHFKFEETDENGNKYTFEETIGSPYDEGYERELEYLLAQFKSFLAATGWSEFNLMRLQYLEGDDLKNYLQKNGGWEPQYEKYIKYDNGRNNTHEW